jgi:serine/threonine protein kinase
MSIRYRKLQRLGRGAFGEIFLAISPTKEKVLQK